jgi:hypothetical protein
MAWLPADVVLLACDFAVVSAQSAPLQPPAEALVHWEVSRLYADVFLLACNCAVVDLQSAPLQPPAEQ